MHNPAHPGEIARDNLDADGLARDRVQREVVVCKPGRNCLRSRSEV